MKITVCRKCGCGVVEANICPHCHVNLNRFHFPGLVIASLALTATVLSAGINAVPEDSVMESESYVNLRQSSTVEQSRQTTELMAPYVLDFSYRRQPNKS